MTPQYLRPRLLETNDALDTFECGSAEQTAWLQRHARQANATGTAKVLVVTEIDSPEVIAYYAWAMANITVEDTPARMRKGAGRYPQPVAPLARLGVDLAHERQGLGAALLKDAITRSAELGATIGCRGLLVHAETDTARDFYLHLIPEFEHSPTDPLHLVLMMKDIHHTLRAG
ncbi:MAG: GNAT family N-acetyltransferase [Actinomycetia bacterium]|nr:GNAT family N-acetyltransferase [Actinomycetes bacterium]